MSRCNSYWDDGEGQCEMEDGHDGAHEGHIYTSWLSSERPDHASWIQRLADLQSANASLRQGVETLRTAMEGVYRMRKLSDKENFCPCEAECSCGECSLCLARAALRETEGLAATKVRCDCEGKCLCEGLVKP